MILSKANQKSTFWVIGIVVTVLLIDQLTKIWVKTNMEYGQEFLIFGLEWARIHFVENKGMAFGMSFGGDAGKLALSLFRIVAVGFIIYIIRQLIQSKEGLGVLVCFALILAGALGNIIDSVFYGMIFSDSPYHGGLAELFPDEGGYGKFLHGKVVDMFYFPLFEIGLPKWLPFWGGQPFEFFRPVFNVADSAISVGIALLLIFYRQFFITENKEDKEGKETGSVESPII